MKTRYDKLIVVRRVASRLASAELAGASARVARHQAIVGRLDDATCALAPAAGPGSGASLGACHELSARMQTARRGAQAQVDIASADRDDAALARRSARRALDAAIDVRRADCKAQAARKLENSLPATVRKEPK